MTFLESEARQGNQHLVLRGVVSAVVCALIVALLVAKSNGNLDRRVEVVALLSEVGDGLPTRSDVKFRGVLVGTVDGVDPAIGAGLNRVSINLKPEYAGGVPQTVTARVVPSNAFAVSSVELIDNGPGPGLTTGDEIVQDDSEATIQFQVALTKLREIVAAVGRSRSDTTVGVMTALAEATDGKRADIVEAGRQLERIVGEMNAFMQPGQGPSTIRAFTEAVVALDDSAPDLLNAVHESIVPMRTVAEKREEILSFLSAGGYTLGTFETAMDNNTDRMISISTKMTPVIGVLADNAESFVPITTQLKVTAERFLTHVYNPETGLAKSKMILSLSPNRPYVRADCPRYGSLAGPSCFTAPVTAAPQQPMPASMDPGKYRLPEGFTLPPGFTGGNVGPVGSKKEMDILRQLLGKDANVAAALLAGPVLRGMNVHIEPGGSEEDDTERDEEAGGR